MAALTTSAFSRTRLTSSPVAVVAVDDVLLLACEYPDKVDDVVDHRGRLSVPSTRMFGTEGDCSSGDKGLSSKIVVGVSGTCIDCSGTAIKLLCRLTYVGDWLK